MYTLIFQLALIQLSKLKAFPIFFSRKNSLKIPCSIYPGMACPILHLMCKETSLIHGGIWEAGVYFTEQHNMCKKNFLASCFNLIHLPGDDCRILLVSSGPCDWNGRIIRHVWGERTVVICTCVCWIYFRGLFCLWCRSADASLGKRRYNMILFILDFYSLLCHNQIT